MSRKLSRKLQLRGTRRALGVSRAGQTTTDAPATLAVDDTRTADTRTADTRTADTRTADAKGSPGRNASCWS
jgi:hypothetical protein